MILDFFNKNKEYISCEYLEHGIHFHVEGIYHCCCCFHSDENNSPVVNSSGNINIDFKKFIKQKQNDRELFRHGHIIKRCKNCFHLEKKQWDRKNIINLISITANQKCNCDCCYCETHKDKCLYNSIPDLPVYDFIKKMYQSHIISKDCNIDFGGGEPTLHFEFEKLIDLLIDITDTRICIYTSGIKYSNAIEKLIKLNRANIVISLDSGNAELYRKIKNVNTFDIVSKNIKRYCDVQKYTTELHQVALKYIILPGINDKPEFINEFLNHAKELNCHAIRTDVERHWYIENKDNNESIKYILQLMKYIAVNAEKMGFQHFFNLTANGVYNNNTDLYNEINIL